jgi:hypothetical protein
VLERDRPHGLIVDDNPANYTHPRLIADFAARQKIPALTLVASSSMQGV